MFNEALAPPRLEHPPHGSRQRRAAADGALPHLRRAVLASNADLALEAVEDEVVVVLGPGRAHRRQRRPRRDARDRRRVGGHAHEPGYSGDLALGVLPQRLVADPADVRVAAPRPPAAEVGPDAAAVREPAEDALAEGLDRHVRRVHVRGEELVERY